MLTNNTYEAGFSEAQDESLVNPDVSLRAVDDPLCPLAIPKTIIAFIRGFCIAGILLSMVCLYGSQHLKRHYDMKVEDLPGNCHEEAESFGIDVTLAAASFDCVKGSGSVWTGLIYGRDTTCSVVIPHYECRSWTDPSLRVGDCEFYVLTDNSNHKVLRLRSCWVGGPSLDDRVSHFTQINFDYIYDPRADIASSVGGFFLIMSLLYGYGELRYGLVKCRGLGIISGLFIIFVPSTVMMVSR